MTTPAVRTIHTPGEAARQLGLSTSDLVAIIRRHRYSFTEIKPGGKPGDRGRNRWGLTDAQLDAIVRGQERGFAPPEPETIPSPSKASPAGQSLLRRGKGRARLTP